MGGPAAARRGYLNVLPPMRRKIDAPGRDASWLRLLERFATFPRGAAVRLGGRADGVSAVAFGSPLGHRSGDLGNGAPHAALVVRGVRLLRGAAKLLNPGGKPLILLWFGIGHQS
jgi:hypothetical protein